MLAAVLTGYCRLAVTVPRAVRAHPRGWSGVAAGLGIGGLWLVGVAAPGLGAVTALCWLLAVAAAAGLGALLARSAGDARAGVAAGLLGGLAGGLLTFSVGLSVLYARPDWFADAGAAGRYQASGAPDLTSYLVSDYLGGSIALLLVIPMITVAFAAAGAALAIRPVPLGPELAVEPER